MKKSISIFIISLIFILAWFGNKASAAELKWDASGGDVGGYYVYQGIKSGEYPVRTDVGNVLVVQEMADFFKLDSNTKYYFAVAGYNSSGESDLSNEATYTTPEAGKPPRKVTITITADNATIAVEPE